MLAALLFVLFPCDNFSLAVRAFFLRLFPIEATETVSSLSCKPIEDRFNGKGCATFSGDNETDFSTNEYPIDISSSVVANGSNMKRFSSSADLDTLCDRSAAAIGSI